MARTSDRLRTWTHGATVDLTRPRDVRGLLNRYGVRLSRELGQHLLVDRDVLQRIVAAADLTPQTEVLEVGPGVGALTAELSRAAGRVVAVELDRRLVDLLRETVPSPNVEVIQGDALQANLPSLFSGSALQRGGQPALQRGHAPHPAPPLRRLRRPVRSCWC